MALYEGAPRKVLADVLKPLLPRDWRLVERLADGGDHVEKPTVRLKHLSIERAPAAPATVHDNRIVVTITARTPTAAAEDELDDQIVELLHALDTAGITWTGAEKTVDGDRLAWDVTTHLPTHPTPHE